MRVLSVVTLPLKPSGTAFDISLQLESHEIARLRQLDYNLLPAFFMPGTDRFPGHMGFSVGRYTEPISITLYPSIIEALGLASPEQAAGWVVEKLTAYLR